MTASCHAADARSLSPVALHVLPAEEDLPVDVYWRPDDRRTVLLLAQGRRLRAEDIDRMRRRGIEAVHMAAEEAARLRERFLERVLGDETRPPAARFALLRDTMREAFHEAFHHGAVEQVVPATCEYAAGLAAVVGRCGGGFADLAGAMAADASNFTHATNVATYSLLLAADLGMGGPRERAAIAQGALLHDVGKPLLRRAKRHGGGPRGRADREVVREHPTRGFEALCRRADVPSDSLMIVYQHHERYDGCGYPVGLVGNEIHPWARIGAIADVFDVLRRHRLRRAAACAGRVPAYFAREAGRRFDKELVQCWTTVVTQRR